MKAMSANSLAMLVNMTDWPNSWAMWASRMANWDYRTVNLANNAVMSMDSVGLVDFAACNEVRLDCKMDCGLSSWAMHCMMDWHWQWPARMLQQRVKMQRPAKIQHPVSSPLQSLDSNRRHMRE